MRRTLLLVAAFLLAFAAPAAAQYTSDSSIVIRSFDTELRVQPDGTVEVREKLRLKFTGEWRGILRDLALDHNTARGRRERLEIEIDGAVDGEGEALRWQEDDAESSWTRRMRIFIPRAHNRERTVIIRYRVRNAVRFYFAGDAMGDVRAVADFDELYWNATGVSWDMPIERATARIFLPPGVRPLQWDGYAGPAGSTERGVSVSVDSARGVVAFRSERELGAFEGMTVAVGWPAGAIAMRPTKAEVRRAEAERMWPLLLPILTFLFGLRAWARRGRDPRAQSVVVKYEPPEGMTPAEVGTLIDHEAEMRDITSTLVDLAVRGYVGIEEQQEKKLLGLITSTEYVFHRRTPPELAPPLLAHEERFLSGLFAGASSSSTSWDEVRATWDEARRASGAAFSEDGDPPRRTARRRQTESTVSVRLSELTNEFYTSLDGIREGIYASLISRGYYRARPDQVKASWIGFGVFVGILGLVATAVVFDEGLPWVNTGALALGSIVAAVLLMVFGQLMPARTEAGARAREAALGFREFLARVESDRYRRMVTSPEMFERFLPYAMAFGVEDRWAAAFEDLYREPPGWYSGSGDYGDFRASSFTSRMSSLSSSASSTMSSSPSSSSSGSSGGGSSGGGSGGGGGSGF